MSSKGFAKSADSSLNR